MVLIILLQAYCSSGVKLSSFSAYQTFAYGLQALFSSGWGSYVDIVTVSIYKYHEAQTNQWEGIFIFVQQGQRFTLWIQQGIYWLAIVQAIYNHFYLKFNMQKRNYQQFRDEQETELPNYHNSIPVGQPINPSSYPQQQQFVQQPQQFMPQPPHIMHPQPNVYPPPPVFHMPPPGQPQMAQSFNFPVHIQCPCCKMNVPTIVNQQSGNTTYLWCGFIGLCVSPLCCCIPFLMDSCLDKTHYCPNCGHNILRKHQRCFQFLGC